MAALISFVAYFIHKFCARSIEINSDHTFVSSSIFGQISEMPNPAEVWRVGQPADGVQGNGDEIFKPEYFQTIEESIASLDGSLRDLSLDISGLPRACP